MNAERWQRIESVYHAARALRGDQRSRLLDDRCGSDSAMRRQVEALLAQDDNLSKFLNQPALDWATEWRSTGNPPDFVGLRVGAYEVVEHIGSGGMSDVYRARDANLARDVALKLLPPLLALDPDRVGRFRREAQIVASFNHPNIAAIYGIEEAHVSLDSGDAVVRALVMEFIDGPTLADRIAQGPIPVDEVLPIARQITEALSVAHEHGVIHRDLKPANVKLRPDGVVKVLDFGLAKSLEPVNAGTPASDGATTEAGMILGTAAYMSPEQVKGQPADKRSDVWAFGCVTYEMLTGIRAFSGEDGSDTRAAVLRDEPEWTRLPTAATPSLRALIQGCLQKDRRQCIADISSVRFLLSDSQINASIPRHPAQSPPFAPRTLAFAATAIIVGGILGLGIWGIRSLRSSGAANVALRFAVTAPRGTSFGSREQPIFPTISPDGTRIVFVVLRQGEPLLAVRAIDELEAQVLNGTEGARFPFWSPDSRIIAFFAGGKLKTIGASTGSVQVLAEAALALGGTWNRDGLIVFAPSARQALVKVAATGGQPSPVTTLRDDETYHARPQFLPDGRRFLYVAASSRGTLSPPPPRPSALYLGSIDGTPPVRVLSATAAVYAASGHLLLMEEPGGPLLAQRFDADRARLIGDRMQIGESVLGLGENISVSENGVLAYAADPAVDVRLAWVDRAGRPIGLVGPFPFGSYAAPELSPDGSQIAVESIPRPHTQSAPWINEEIWVFDLARGRSTQLTFDTASDERPVWSPDGSQVAFSSRRSGAEGLYRKAVSNESPEELLLRAVGGSVPWPWQWSSHGIVYDSGGANADLWLLPLTGDRKSVVLASDAASQLDAQFSPDGRWFAYRSDELGRPEVFVKSFPPTESKQRISTSGGLRPRWRRDGRELFYLAADGRLMAVSVASGGNSLRFDVARPLFQTGLSGRYPGLRTYGVSSDGDRFLISMSDDPGAAASIVVVSNWPAALKR